MTTTISIPTRQEPRVCGQSLAGMASLGIVVHVVHEFATLSGAMPAWQAIVLVAVVGATLALTVSWHRLPWRSRRAAAVVLGLLWTAAATEHLTGLASGVTALDLSGMLAFLGGLTLVFAAYWDHRRPVELTR